MDPSDETIGRRLRRLRLAEGLSQRELAAEGVSYAYISRIEAGTRRPSVKALRTLAVGLGVTPEYLEHGAEVTTTDSVAEMLVNISGAGFRVEMAREQTDDGWRIKHGPSAVAVTFGVDQRVVTGTTATEALLRAVEWCRELERLQIERDAIDSKIERLAG